VTSLQSVKSNYKDYFTGFTNKQLTQSSV